MIARWRKRIPDVAHVAASRKLSGDLTVSVGCKSKTQQQYQTAINGSGIAP
jgi:hypothetical protein